MKKKLDDIKVKAVHSEPKDSKTQRKKKEIGGPNGLEPTRYGDCENKGRCIDF